MAYEKLGFVKGQKLKADHLNHMEDGIANAGGADWNASEGESGYVANRTHSRKINVTEFPETEVLFENTNAPLPVYMAPFVFDVSIGDRVDVILDGNTFVCVVKHDDADMLLYVGNSSIIGIPNTSNEPFIMIFSDEGLIIGISDTENLTHTLAIRHYSEDVQKLDNIYLQDNVTKYGAIGEVIRIEWDGNTDGLDTFVCNGFNYYKVSDIVVPSNHIARFSSKKNNESEVKEYDYISEGTNCYDIDMTKVITKAGICKEHSSGATFTAPSEGIYFMKYNYTTGLEYQELIELDTRRENSILYLTDACGVKHEITMDDNGNLTTGKPNGILIVSPAGWTDDNDIIPNVTLNEALSAIRNGQNVYLQTYGGCMPVYEFDDSYIRFAEIQLTGRTYLRIEQYTWDSYENVIYKQFDETYTLQLGGVE